MVDYKISMKWNLFIRYKRDLAETMLPCIRKFNSEKCAKTTHSENMGENKELQKYFEARNMSIKFEYMAPTNTHQNGVVEKVLLGYWDVYMLL